MLYLRAPSVENLEGNDTRETEHLYIRHVCTYVDTVGTQGTRYQTRILTGNSTLVLGLGLGSLTSWDPAGHDRETASRPSSPRSTKQGSTTVKCETSCWLPGQLETAPLQCSLHGSHSSNTWVSDRTRGKPYHGVEKIENHREEKRGFCRKEEEEKRSVERGRAKLKR
jgi:hypothetical protein